MPQPATHRRNLALALAAGLSATAVSAADLTSTQLRADLTAGQEKALLCVSCHGQAGISSVPMYPNLAGQKELYLRKQLADFRSGYRPSLVMAPMAKNLSDEDIVNLAGYFASLEP